MYDLLFTSSWGHLAIIFIMVIALNILTLVIAAFLLAQLKTAPAIIALIIGLAVRLVIITLGIICLYNSFTLFTHYDDSFGSFALAALYALSGLSFIFIKKNRTKTS